MILQLFLASIKRLRQELGIPIPVVVVGDESHKSICEEYYVTHITQENDKASRKWNIGVEHMMSIGMDYVVILGSDDICSTTLIRNLMSAMDRNVDLIGINTIYFYAGDGVHRGKLKKLVTTKYLGVARTIHKRIIEKAGTLWTRDRRWGMDADCMSNIRPHVKTKEIVEGICVDVKSRENLNKITFWMSKIRIETPVEEFHNILSDEEKRILLEV